jgi:hypothetical protein
MQNQNTEHLTEHRAANDVDSYSEQQEQTKKLHALNFANFMKERGYIYLNRQQGPELYSIWTGKHIPTTRSTIYFFNGTKSSLK